MSGSLYALAVLHRVDDPEDGWCKVPHVFARSDLSARAVKVGLYLASHQDGWRTSRRRIGAALGMGRKVVGLAVLDLIEAGLLIVSGDDWHLDLLAGGESNRPT